MPHKVVSSATADSACETVPMSLRLSLRGEAQDLLSGWDLGQSGEQRTLSLFSSWWWQVWEEL